MTSNEIEEQLEKDNMTIKEQIMNLQKTIKKLKNDMFTSKAESEKPSIQEEYREPAIPNKKAYADDKNSLTDSQERNFKFSFNERQYQNEFKNPPQQQQKFAEDEEEDISPYRDSGAFIDYEKMEKYGKGFPVKNPNSINNVNINPNMNTNLNTNASANFGYEDNRRNYEAQTNTINTHYNSNHNTNNNSVENSFNSGKKNFYQENFEKIRREKKLISQMNEMKQSFKEKNSPFKNNFYNNLSNMNDTENSEEIEKILSKDKETQSKLQNIGRKFKNFDIEDNELQLEDLEPKKIQSKKEKYSEEEKSDTSLDRKIQKLQRKQFTINPTKQITTPKTKKRNKSFSKLVRPVTSKSIKKSGGDSSRNFNTANFNEIKSYQNEIALLKKEVLKLKTENEKLKTSLAKEKQQNEKYRSLTEEIIKHYEKTKKKK